jgi:CRP-like cAMP-binding protein
MTKPTADFVERWRDSLRRPEQRPPHLARRSDPDTSHEAAGRMVQSGARDGQCEKALHALRRAGTCTSAELAERMGIDRYVTGRRLPDLEKRGLVAKDDKKVCRISGTRAVTWRAL